MDIRLTLTTSQADALLDVLALHPSRRHDTTLGPLWHELNEQLSAALCGQIAAPCEDPRLSPTLLSSE